jgi:hypothetical protein
MRNDLTLVRFTKDAFEERAHPKDSQRGGFALHKIPAGTQMRMSVRSIEFWRARDADLIEIVKPVAGVGVRVDAGPAAVVDDVKPVVEWTEEQKTQLRQAVDAALMGTGDVAAVKALDPGSLPGVDSSDITQLDDPFRYPEALRSIRRLVPARRGRKPRV